MNKTVNINIGGLFFHIDEDAFQKLSRYFDAIRRSLTNSSGKEEIMKDIEMRVAELFTDRQKSDKHVINLKDVDEVVTVMGQPEDYRIDDEANETSSANFASGKSKKLYRDKDKGLIGGVCTGLGHYFGVDSIWIKILFLIFVFAGFGTGILAYFILWVITPVAVTTTEKLEMTGEPVTISNIERKVREEFENVSNKIKSVDYDKMGNQIKSTTENAGNKIGNAFSAVFGAFAKVLGALIVVFSSISLLGICIASVFLMFSSSLPDNTVFNHINTPIGLETPLWTQGILLLLAVGIPLFFILILGLKLLVTNLKSIGSVAKYSLLALWIIAVGILISLGIKEASQIAYDGKEVKKETININPSDTLFIKFKNNDFYSKNYNEHRDLWLTQDENNQEVIYSNNVTIRIMKTDETLPYVQIEKLAHGKSPAEAKKRAEKIRYDYKIQGNQLILDNFLLTEIGNKFRDQHIEIYLYLPKGTYFKPDSSVENYDRTDNDFFNLHYSSDNYTYKVDDSKVKCLNCPAYEDEYNDVDDSGIEQDSTATIQLNKDGILIKTDASKNNTEETKKSENGNSVTINKEGVIIKTK
jgi:phage shock protein PspC (stress-responsive transcriptional regulator)